MNKRTKEIEAAMDTIDCCVFNISNAAVDAWDIVYEYIKQLEYTIQQMIAVEERKIDDGK